MIASCDQSLKGMGLDYVDIFYSHRVDPKTPLEETMGALAHLHRQGKALYVGISSYSPELTRKAAAILAGYKVPLLIHQPSYSMLNRWIEDDLLDTLRSEEHTSELQSLMRISYAVFCLNKKKKTQRLNIT